MKSIIYYVDCIECITMTEKNRIEQTGMFIPLSSIIQIVHMKKENDNRYHRIIVTETSSTSEYTIDIFDLEFFFFVCLVYKSK
jgi:hypothetical protein